VSDALEDRVALVERVLERAALSRGTAYAGDGIGALVLADGDHGAGRNAATSGASITPM
jgi:hypothetical protein